MPEYIVQTVQEGVDLLAPGAPDNEARLRKVEQLMGEYTTGLIKGADGNYYIDFGIVYAVAWFQKFVTVLADEGAEGFRQATLKDILLMSVRYSDDTPGPQPGDYAYGFHYLRPGVPLMVGTGRVLENSVCHNVPISLVVSEWDDRVIGGLSEECSQAWQEIFAEQEQQSMGAGESPWLGWMISFSCIICWTCLFLYHVWS